MNNGTIVIVSQKMAGWLMSNGFVLLGTRKDLKNQTKNIFIFNDSENLRSTMSRFNEFKKFLAEIAS